MSSYFQVQDEWIGFVSITMQYTRKDHSGGPTWDMVIMTMPSSVAFWRWDIALNKYVYTGETTSIAPRGVHCAVLPNGSDDPGDPNAIIYFGDQDGNCYSGHVNGPSPTPIALLIASGGTEPCLSIDCRWDLVLWGRGIGRTPPTMSDSATYQGLTGFIVQSFPDHADWITRFVWSRTPMADMWFSTSLDTITKAYGAVNNISYSFLYDLIPIYNPPQPHPPCEYADVAEYSVADVFVAVGCSNGDVQTYDPHLPICMSTFNVGSRIWQVAYKRAPWDPSVFLVAVACDDGLQIWDSTNSILHQSIVVMSGGSPMACYTVTFDVDGFKICTAWGDQRARWFEL